MSDMKDFEIENGVLLKYSGDEAYVEIPEGVSSISREAFHGCQQVKSIRIPEGVLRIEDGNPVWHSGAFSNCDQLENVEFPESLEYIGSFAFFFCSKLKVISIPQKITQINQGTFWECRELADISLPSGLTAIGQSAFADCSSLAEIIIPDGVRTIEKNAFNYCLRLKRVQLPAEVAKVSKSAFEGCRYLKCIDIAGGLKTTKRLSTALTSCPLECTDEEFAYLALFQAGKPWQKWVVESLKNRDIEQVFVKILSIAQENGKLPSAATQNLYGILNVFDEKLPEDLKKQANQFLSGKAETGKKEKKENKNTEINIQGYLSVIEKTIKIPKLLQWAKKGGIDADELCNAINKNNKNSVPAEAAPYILYAYMSQMPKTPPYHAGSYKTDIVELHKVLDADSIADLIGKETLKKIIVMYKTTLEIWFDSYAEMNEDAKKDFKIEPESVKIIDETSQIKIPLFPAAFTYGSKELIYYEGWSKDPYCSYLSHPQILNHSFLLPYCRYAEADQIADLIKSAENLIKNWGKVGRLVAVIIRSALLLSDTKEAASYLDKYGHLGVYASMRNTTEREVRRMLLSESGLNSNGSISFDL